MPFKAMEDLARHLLAVELASKNAADTRMQHEAVRVCEKLRISLTRFAGADGFTSLLRRALALARADVPSLNRISVNHDCSMEGLNALVTESTDGGVEAGLAITAHLLGLLATFIGEPLMLRLVREAWPNESLDELHDKDRRDE